MTSPSADLPALPENDIVNLTQAVGELGATRVHELQGDGAFKALTIFDEPELMEFAQALYKRGLDAAQAHAAALLARAEAAETDAARYRWRSVDDELPPLNIEVLVAFDAVSLPATAQLTLFKGMRQWMWPAENDEQDTSLAVAHWMPLPEHPDAARFEAVDAARKEERT